jgi:hypothetical protein
MQHKPIATKPVAAKKGRLEKFKESAEIAATLATAPDDFLLDAKMVGAFFGGPAPLVPSSVYRMTKGGIVPPPEKAGRWNLGKCRKAKADWLSKRTVKRDAAADAVGV